MTRVLAVLALAGCVAQADGFACQRDASCARGDVQGWCEPSGFCSFPDMGCAETGRRYGRSAGDDLGDRCVVKECPDRFIAEDFDNPTIATTWIPYSVVGANPATNCADMGLCFQADGELVLDVGAATADSYTGINSLPYDLRGSWVFAIPGEVLTSSTTYAELMVGRAPDDRVSVREVMGMLQFISSVGTQWNVIASIPYDPAEHRIWQIRETVGTTYWETSRDGAAWTVQAQQPTSVNPFDAARIGLEAGANTAQPTSQKRFERLTGCHL